jgi:hypothetical protein
MTNNFSEVMSQQTDQQLAAILTTKRHEYQDEAIVAAQAEFDKRMLNLNAFVTEDQNKTETTLNPDSKEELRLNLLYKILTFILPGPVTAIWGFICTYMLELPVLKSLSLLIVILTQVLIFRKLKANGFTKLALDFKLWTLNSWIFFAFLAVIISGLEFFLRHR